MNTDIINAEPQGEVYGLVKPQGEGSSLAVQMARAELDQNVFTAKTYPRSFKRAMNNILSLVTLDEVSAAECVYALPRGGKPIKGPSVRFAEIVASQWGNCHCGSRVIAVDTVDKVVIAEGVFWDLETGMKRVAQVRRRITDKNGRLFNEDMIVVTGNAACSVAMREAILKGVPKAIWRGAYEAAERVIAGDVKTLKVRRDDAIKAFFAFGVTPEMICATLDVAGVEDIDLDEIATLISMFKAIKAGDEKAETYFPELTGKPRATKAAPKPQAVAETVAPRAEPAKEEAKQEQADPKPEPAAATKSEPADAEPGLPLGDKPATIDARGMYDTILADALEVGAAKAKEAHADRLAQLEAHAPKVFADLMGELDGFSE